MSFTPTQLGSRQSPAPQLHRYLWTARGLFLLATVLLVWAAASFLSADSVKQAAPGQSTPGPLGQPSSAGSGQGADRQRADQQLRRPPPPPPARPARAVAYKVKRPEPSMEPESIKIPALSIDQRLTELGVIGTDLQVPDDYSDVGWWSGGPSPGEQGASVMVGHVDSPTGPAVFYQLSGLRPGHEIVVDLDDGSRTVFAVRRVHVYERTQFPSTQVYRTRGKPALHLVTCGGTFDAEAGQYTSNVVVYADFVDRILARADTPRGSQRLVQDSPRRLSQGRQEDRLADKPRRYQRLTQNSQEKLEQQRRQRQ